MKAIFKDLEYYGDKNDNAKEIVHDVVIQNDIMEKAKLVITMQDEKSIPVFEFKNSNLSKLEESLIEQCLKETINDWLFNFDITVEL